MKRAREADAELMEEKTCFRRIFENEPEGEP
jgi:hypothetical protein